MIKLGIYCRLCAVNDEDKQEPAGDVQHIVFFYSLVVVKRSKGYNFKHCTICIRKCVDQDDVVGVKDGECRQCVEARVLQCSLANAKPKKPSSVGAYLWSHQRGLRTSASRFPL